MAKIPVTGGQKQSEPWVGLYWWEHEKCLVNKEKFLVLVQDDL